MAVSKRLRYEILRRDNHTCRYCMTATPGTPLRVDHVVPVALGGTDDPTNLAASCEPCNSGKTSTVPDSPLVAQVREDAMRWQMAWAVAVAEAETEGQQRTKNIAKVKKSYVAAYKGRHGVAPALPEGWEASVGRWLDLGLPLTLIDKAIASAVGRTYVPAKDRFAYFAGCCWSLLRELKDRTEQIAKHPDGTHEGPQEDEDKDEYDERNAVEHAIDSYSDGWHLDYDGPSATAEQVNAVAAFAKAASAAGYERLSIACATFKAGTDHNGDPNTYLETVDSVLGREAERIGTERPYGSMGIPIDLLPTPEDQAERAVPEAAVAAWRLAWHCAGGTPPGRYSAAGAEVHSQALDAFRSSGDAQEIMRGAEHAEGSVNLLQALDAANEYNALEPAISAWYTAYCAAMGSAPAVEAEQDVWSSARALRKSSVWDHQIITAATFAGAHATTRMHFGLSRDEAKVIGVKANTQRLEDCWAHSWFESWSTWPNEEDRAAFRACLLAIAEGEAHQVRDIAAAAIAAGAYQSTDLYPSLTRSLSTFATAAHLPHLGGE